MVYTIERHVVATNVKDVRESVLWELLMTVGVSLPFFTLGIETFLGKPVNDVILPFIFNNITMWYQTAMLVAAAVSAPVFAFISQWFGRKAGYFCISLVQGLVLIPVFINTRDSLPYTYILIGISSGGVFTVLLPYIKEITSTRIRGSCLVFPSVLLLAGYQLRVMGEWNDLMTYLAVVLVAVQLILLLGIVESPSYLVMVGKPELAKAALSSLKRLPVDNPIILRKINRLDDDVSRGTRGKITLLSLYRNKICWDSIKMGVLLFTTLELCGSISFGDAKNVWKELNDPNIIVSIVLVGSVLTMLAITCCDRKYILTFGYGTLGVSLGVYAVYDQLSSTQSSPEQQLRSSIMMIVLLVAYAIIFGLPALMVVELFNTKICTLILAALFTYSQLLRLLHEQTFIYLEKYVGNHAMFYIFAGVNLYGGVYSLFVLPNIRNKTMRQIAKQVKRIPLPA